MLNTHTHKQLWSISTTPTRPGESPPERSLLVSWPQANICIFFPFLFCWRHKQASTHTIHRHLPLCTRRDDDAYDTRKEKYHFRTTFVLNAYHDGCTRLTIYGICMRGRYHRDREERALSSAFLGWHHGEGGGIPRPWWGLRSSPWDFRPNCPLAEPAATNPSFLLLLPYSVC